MQHEALCALYSLQKDTGKNIAMSDTDTVNYISNDNEQQIQQQQQKQKQLQTSILVCSQTGSGKTLIFLLPILQELRSNPIAEALVLAPTDLLLDQHESIATLLDPIATKRIHFVCSSSSNSSSSSAVNDGPLKSSHNRIFDNDMIRILAFDEVDAVLYGCSKETDGTLTNNDNKNINININNNAMDENTQLSPIGSAILQRYRVQTQMMIGTAAFLSKIHTQILLERDFCLVHTKPLLIREPGIMSHQTQVLVPTLRQRFKYFSGNRLEKLESVLHVEQQDPKNDWLRNGSTMIFCKNVQQASEVYARLILQQRKTVTTESNNNKNKNSSSSSNNRKSLQLLHEELSREQMQELLLNLRAMDNFGTKCNDNIDDVSATATTTRTIIVCTDIAARGLDVPNIRHVILYEVPTTVSSFVHQVGRTARKGESGILTSLIATEGGDAQKYKHLHALSGASHLFG